MNLHLKYLDRYNNFIWYTLPLGYDISGHYNAAFQLDVALLG